MRGQYSDCQLYRIHTRLTHRRVKMSFHRMKMMKAAVLRFVPRQFFPEDGKGIALFALKFVFCLTAANALFNSIASALGAEFPYNTFLFDPTDLFADFFSVIFSYPGGEEYASQLTQLKDQVKYTTLNPYGGAELLASGATPQITHFHLTPLSTLLSVGALAIADVVPPFTLFILLNVLFLVYAAVIWSKFGRNKGEALTWIALGMLSYPTLLALTRGNLFAALTGTLLIHAILHSLRGKHVIFGAVLLAVAVNVRPNSIIFLLFLLSVAWPSKWKILCVFAIASLMIFLSSLVAANALYPSYNIRNFVAGLEVYYNLYVLQDKGVAMGSSLSGALKAFATYGGVRDWIPTLNLLSLIASTITACAALVLYYFKLLSRPTLLFMLCAVYALGSTVFGDYHLLVFLAVPMSQALELRRGKEAFEREPQLFSWCALITSCLLLSPKNYVYSGESSFQVIINPMLLSAGAAAILIWAGWRLRLEGSSAHQC